MKKAAENLPNFFAIASMEDMVEADEDFGDEVAENALNAVVEFNDDMRFLALNAF